MRAAGSACSQCYKSTLRASWPCRGSEGYLPSSWELSQEHCESAAKVANLIFSTIFFWPEGAPGLRSCRTGARESSLSAEGFSGTEPTDALRQHRGGLQCRILGTWFSRIILATPRTRLTFKGRIKGGRYRQSWVCWPHSYAFCTSLRCACPPSDDEGFKSCPGCCAAGLGRAM